MTIKEQIQSLNTCISILQNQIKEIKSKCEHDDCIKNENGDFKCLECGETLSYCDYVISRL